MASIIKRDRMGHPASWLKHLWDLLLFLWIVLAAVFFAVLVAITLVSMTNALDHPQSIPATIGKGAILLWALPVYIVLAFLGPYLQRRRLLRKVRHTIGDILTLKRFI